VKEISRAWTPEEQEELLETYFSPSCGLCPVCSNEVCMVMTHVGRTVTILMSCEQCGNKASINGPLLAPKRVHRTDEDESLWD
jgi:hypothetical protein